MNRLHLQPAPALDLESEEIRENIGRSLSEVEGSCLP